MPKRVFFTSDTHFWHGNIIKYCNRPFLGEADRQELSRIGGWHDGVWKSESASKWRISREGIEIMNETLIEEINCIVEEDDILYHLGDFGMAPKKGSSQNRFQRYYDECREVRNRIKCQNIHLVFGNHDDEMIGDLFSTAERANHVFVPELNRDVAIFHYLQGIWNCSHRGALQLYGHSHSEAEAFWDNLLPERRNMDVGVDNAAKLLKAYRPFSCKDIEKFLGKRQGVFFDHHTPRIPADTTSECDLV